MAKNPKRVRETPVEKEKVFSKNYGCYITKEEAYWSEEEQSWLSEKIEKVIGRGKKLGIVDFGHTLMAKLFV